MSKLPLTIPSIEVPTTDVRSLQNTLMQVKEAIELMAGVRGAGPFAYASDMEASINRLTKLEKNAGWDIIYDQAFSGTTGFNITNLGAYRTLRMSLHVIPASAVAIYMRVGTGGIFAGSSGNYIGNGMFNTEASATVNGYLQADSTTIPLSWENNIAVNTFGLTVNALINNFNTPVQTKMAMQASFYNGSNVIQGVLHSREAGVVARDCLHIAGVGDTTVLSGYLLLEGHKL